MAVPDDMKDRAFLMTGGDMEALTAILQRLRASNPDHQGFHVSVPLNDTLYADAHITIRPMS